MPRSVCEFSNVPFNEPYDCLEEYYTHEQQFDKNFAVIIIKRILFVVFALFLYRIYVRFLLNQNLTTFYDQQVVLEGTWFEADNLRGGGGGGADIEIQVSSSHDVGVHNSPAPIRSTRKTGSVKKTPFASSFKKGSVQDKINQLLLNADLDNKLTVDSSKVKTNFQAVQNSPILSANMKSQFESTIKELLASPTFSYTNKKGEEQTLNYANSTFRLRPEVQCDLANHFVSFNGTISTYRYYKSDYTCFNKRVKCIQKILSEFSNNELILEFKVQQEVFIPNGKGSVDFSPDGDHIEGIRALRATNRTKYDTLVVVKPHYVHLRQTKERTTIESERIQHVEKCKVDNKEVLVTGNKTYLSKDHTIETYFNFRIEDSRKCYNSIPDDYFPENCFRNLLIEAENKALSIQKNIYLKSLADEGLNERDTLVNMKAQSAMNQCIDDITRLDTKLRIASEHWLNQNSETNQVCSPANIGKWAAIVLNQALDCNIFIKGLRYNFAAPFEKYHYNALSRNLEILLITQESPVNRLVGAFGRCNVTLAPDSFTSFTPYPIEDRNIPENAKRREEIARLSSLEELDNRGARLQVDCFEGTMRTFPNKLPKNYSITEERSNDPPVPIEILLHHSTAKVTGLDPEEMTRLRLKEVATSDSGEASSSNSDFGEARSSNFGEITSLDLGEITSLDLKEADSSEHVDDDPASFL